MNLTTSFNTLGIGPDTDDVQAKRAYKAQVRRWHPDQFPAGSPAKTTAEERLKQINIAYARVRTHLAKHRPAPTLSTGTPSPHPDRAGTERRDIPKAKTRAWVDHLFDALDAYAKSHAERPSAPPDDETDTHRRKTFEQVLGEMTGSGFPSKLKRRPGNHPAAGHRAISGHRRPNRNDGAVGTVGGAEGPGPVKPVSRVRGIGRNR
jgi:hypothetical protein